MKRFVLDASVALAWFLDGPTAPYADHVRQRLLRGDRAVVPELWRLEVANGFISAERRGTLTLADTEAALLNLDVVIAQAIEKIPDAVPMRVVLQAARDYRLTSYDAVYLEISRRENLPLATLDRHLAAAATKAGIDLVR